MLIIILSVNSVTQANVVKLPKIEIRKFYGDPLEWKSIYDSFKSAVDENIRLTKVEKMNYLINLFKKVTVKLWLKVYLFAMKIMI